MLGSRENVTLLSSPPLAFAGAAKVALFYCNTDKTARLPDNHAVDIYYKSYSMHLKQDGGGERGGIEDEVADNYKYGL